MECSVHFNHYILTYLEITLNLGKITAEDFVRYFTVAALNDINKMVWIVDKFDNVNHSYLNG